MLFLFILPLYAEDLSISVTDRDLEIPLEGVRIIETSTGIETFTDYDGEAVLSVPDNLERAVLVAELIGYEDKKVLVKDFAEPLILEMLMEGVLEGEELVIEVEAVGETDEEVGVSTVIEKEVIQASSKMGIIEDVMNAVKLLPGVSYSGSFGASLSVRGSDPDGVTAVLDGFVVKYPYHWGGAFSIFNPNIVESVKFSTGVFSSKYGQASSGLLDITTVSPTEGFKFNGVSSTSTLEAFLQYPFGRNREFGVLGGARLTNYDLALKFVDITSSAFNWETLQEMLSAISRAPYIYDFYLKTVYRPDQKFEWYVNGFWGNDGVGSAYADASIDTDTDVFFDFDFRYLNIDLFVNTGVKILAGDNLLIHFLSGYEYWESDIDASITEYGTRFYSDPFLEEFGYLVPPGTDSFFVSTESKYQSSTLKHGVQERLDFDFSVSSRVLLQFGLGSYIDFTDNSGSGQFWTIDQGENGPVYRKLTFENKAEDNRIINSFLYVNSEISLIPDLLSSDFGCRVDHSYLAGEDDFSLNTYPVPGPRLNITFTPPWKNSFFLDNTFSAGTGLFSKTPFESMELNKDLGIEDFEITIPKTFMNLLGWETSLPGGFRFKIEGYYKYIFDLFYYNNVINEDTNKQETLLHNDGKGHAGGFDFLLDRKTSRYIDGLISYSFIYARYYNPESDGTESSSSLRGVWYFPYFHRYHTLNLLINVKPIRSVTFTAKLSFATGTPKREYGEKEMFAGYIENPDGTTAVAEMYSRESFYSDTLRQNISLPLDVKLSVNNYFKNSKLRWSGYIAVEDVLSPILYRVLPRDSVNTSIWSGEDQAAPSAAFSIPLPSIGFELSY